MFTKMIVGLSLMVVSSFAAAQTFTCLNIETFPTTVIDGVNVPKCVAGCPTVRAPRCADVDHVFPPVTPKNPKAVGNYDAVVCTNIATFPIVTHENKKFPKCVAKCQAVRPPKCVDYNTELH